MEISQNIHDNQFVVTIEAIYVSNNIELDVKIASLMENTKRYAQFVGNMDRLSHCKYIHLAVLLELGKGGVNFEVQGAGYHKLPNFSEPHKIKHVTNSKQT